MLDLHRGTINGAMHKSPKGCTSRWRLCLLAGTPAAWASHACDATSLLDVAVGEQFEDQVARSAEASRQIAGHETHVGDDLMFLVKGAHEADRLPMRLCQVDVLLRRQSHRQRFGPLGRINQVALVVGGWQFPYHFHQAPPSDFRTAQSRNNTSWRDIHTT